ncbi:hypothetical protein E6W36_00850 [Hankyongella ginsenosidimutans]|uniref:Uncharacterized protein n=1 Tax=Hankyongella ginsenosidimutans TaxID=1763828 RepID=A0A4D7C7N5_9SPHN|nr:hypothetical protein [Hankyongella ginsenosidimutans]QCI78703.1 hypothetical protein E6W36_00850 [Hankyongella ginsenosidimutans]
MLWFGFVYATVHDMLWFHAAAVPEAIRPQVKPLYFALMHLIGGSSFALGLLGLYVLYGPVRKGVAGAATALTLVYLLPFAVAAYTAVELAERTGAPTAWYNMAILSAITLAGYGAHALSKRGPLAQA